MARSERAGGIIRGFTKSALLARARELGAVEAKIIDPRRVVTAQWVRWKCRYGCGGYASSLTCPPRSPAPDETRRLLDEYAVGVLFEACRREPRKIGVALEREIFLAGNERAFSFGSGPCPFCETCAFDKGCRHPDKARPAMEACGIDVYSTVRRHGFLIEVVKTRRDPCRFFGLVLIG